MVGTCGRGRFGGNFESGGRLMGTQDVQTMQCDKTVQMCSMKVPTLGFALVFLIDLVLPQNTGMESKTFATTTLIKMGNAGELAHFFLVREKPDMVCEATITVTLNLEARGTR
ncbi:hypothetical protein B0H11DRAFT_322421 [Mycena galericulata]|nr:hypothetical protein B0H11DRAFT_322421 [Mycena galericulata]